MLKRVIQGICLGYALYAAPLTGFEVTKDQRGNPYRWEITDNQRYIEYEIDKNLEDKYRESFAKAAERWSGAIEGKIIFIPGSRENGVYVTAESLIQDKNPLVATPAAITYREFDHEKKLITKAKIVFNKDLEFTQISDPKIKAKEKYADLYKSDLDDIMTHELGHVFGLEHCLPYRSSYPFNEYHDYPTMQPVPMEKGVGQTLHEDDIAGIRFLYGLVPQSPQPLTIHHEKRGNSYIFTLEDKVDDTVMWDFGYGFAFFKNDRGKKIKRHLKKGLRTIRAEWNGRIGEYTLQIGKIKTKV